MRVFREGALTFCLPLAGSGASFEVTVVSGKKLITELLANKLLTCALEKGRYRKSVNNLHM